MEGDSSRLARVVGIAMGRPANRGLYPQKNVVGKTLDLGDTVLTGTATRFTRPLTRVRGQDFQRAGGSPRGRERLLAVKSAKPISNEIRISELKTNAPASCKPGHFHISVSQGDAQEACFAR